MDKKIEEKFDSKAFDKEVISIIVTSLIAISVFDIMNIFLNFSTKLGYYTSSYSFRFSVLMSVIVFTLFWMLFKKASKATISCYIIVFLLNLITNLKIIYTGEPLYFSDVKFLNQIGGLFGIVSRGGFSSVHLSTIIGFAIYAIILVAIILLNRKYDIEIKSKKIRISIVIVDILLLLVLFVPNQYTKDFYLKVFFDSENYVDYNSYTNNYSYYMKNGMINGMYGILLNNRFSEPEDYNEEEIKNTLNSIGDTSNTKLGKPNIIVVFAESFFDVNRLEEVQFDKPITSNFNNLKNEGKLINLISPAYGGMSENVAFELFTGGSMNYFPKGYIPIMSLYSKNNIKDRPSIIKVLKENGYNSKITFAKDYYNSEDAFKQIGFDEYVELSDTMDVDEVTDEYAINLIIEELKNKNENDKLFYTIETFEGHMPYLEDKYENYDISIVKSNLDEDENISLRVYSQSIYNTDKQLGKLYEFVKEYNEPTIILFLGDHLPYLYTSNNYNVINDLEYFNTDDELLNYYRKYNTQGLLLANFDISEVEVPEYLGVDLVFANLINQMDIENISFYKWLNSTKDILTASNRYISLDKNGNRYYTNELKDEMKRIYNLKNNMQYMLFMK